MNGVTFFVNAAAFLVQIVLLKATIGKAKSPDINLGESIHSIPLWLCKYLSVISLHEISKECTTQMTLTFGNNTEHQVTQNLHSPGKSLHLQNKLLVKCSVSMKYSHWSPSCIPSFRCRHRFVLQLLRSYLKVSRHIESIACSWQRAK